MRPRRMALSSAAFNNDEPNRRRIQFVIPLWIGMRRIDILLPGVDAPIILMSSLISRDARRSKPSTSWRDR
jgi:hypothetical protein